MFRVSIFYCDAKNYSPHFISLQLFKFGTSVKLLNNLNALMEVIYLIFDILRAIPDRFIRNFRVSWNVSQKYRDIQNKKNWANTKKLIRKYLFPFLFVFSSLPLIKKNLKHFFYRLIRCEDTTWDTEIWVRRDTSHAVCCTRKSWMSRIIHAK